MIRLWRRSRGHAVVLQRCFRLQPDKNKYRDKQQNRPKTCHFGFPVTKTAYYTD